MGKGPYFFGLLFVGLLAGQVPRIFVSLATHPALRVADERCSGRASNGSSRRGVRSRAGGPVS